LVEFNDTEKGTEIISSNILFLDEIIEIIEIYSILCTDLYCQQAIYPFTNPAVGLNFSGLAIRAILSPAQLNLVSFSQSYEAPSSKSIIYYRATNQSFKAKIVFTKAASLSIAQLRQTKTLRARPQYRVISPRATLQTHAQPLAKQQWHPDLC
jgi:hypothetical protein